MSNVMSMKSIKNKTSRNGFDLSQHIAFTAKAGELLPVFTKEVIPGDKFKIKSEWFTRTMPLSSAAYVRMREYYDVYFVPYRQLWKYFPDFITQTENNQYASSFTESASVATKMPYTTVANIFNLFVNIVANATVDGSTTSVKGANQFGYSRRYLSAKLMQYLGYGYRDIYNSDTSSGLGDSSSGSGTTDTTAVSLMPALAYQKICNDYFRFDQWQDSEPWRYNVDYLTPSTGSYLNVSTGDGTTYNMFDLNYCNFNKDLFMGLLPESQFGDVSVASIDINGSATYGFSSEDGDNTTVENGYLNSDGQIVLNGTNYNKISLEGSDVSQLSILALRQAEVLQKWKEITQTGDKDFKSQIEKHFGVNVSNVLSNKCQYVGGWSTNLNINEVVNSNLADDSSEADICGKGTSAGNGIIDFESNDYGILMCIYHAVPLLDYEGAIRDKLVTKIDATDFAIPEFDKIGMEAVPITELIPSVYKLEEGDTLKTLTLGYAPRYYDYKTSVDVVRGAFNASLSHWCSSLTQEYLIEYLQNSITDIANTGKFITSLFFQVNPAYLNPIFYLEADGSAETDQFLCNSYFDIKAVRNLDYNGLPY